MFKSENCHFRRYILLVVADVLQINYYYGYIPKFCVLNRLKLKKGRQILTGTAEPFFCVLFAIKNVVTTFRALFKSKAR